MRVHKKVSALFVLTGIFIIQSRECNEHLIGGERKQYVKEHRALAHTLLGKEKNQSNKRQSKQLMEVSIEPPCKTVQEGKEHKGQRRCSTCRRTGHSGLGRSRSGWFLLG